MGTSERPPSPALSPEIRDTSVSPDLEEAIVDILETGRFSSPSPGDAALSAGGGGGGPGGDGTCWPPSSSRGEAAEYDSRHAAGSSIDRTAGVAGAWAGTSPWTKEKFWNLGSRTLSLAGLNRPGFSSGSVLLL